MLQHLHPKGMLVTMQYCSVPLRWLLFAGYLALLFWLSLSSDPPTPDIEWLGWDKLQHALAYGVLTALGGWALFAHGFLRWKAWLGAALFALVCGGMLEILQGLLTRNRQADILDLVADAIGILIVAGVGFATRLPR